MKKDTLILIVDEIYAGRVFGIGYMSSTPDQRFNWNMKMSQFISSDQFKIKPGHYIEKKNGKFQIVIDDEPTFKFHRRMRIAKETAAQMAAYFAMKAAKREEERAYS